MKMTLTELQAKIGEVSMAIIRGEEIVITRNGKNFARLIPYTKLEKKISTYIYNPSNEKVIENAKSVDAVVKVELNPLTGRPFSGVKKSCPICNEVVAIELATQHYEKKHGDI